MRRQWITCGVWTLTVGMLALWGGLQSASAHCQVPCGIYDDPMRFKMLDEHITTIEKSMKQIATLSANPGKNANQLTRWVMNKETHADAFAEIITAYFLQQRIKPINPKEPKRAAAYRDKLVLCHQMLVAAMKSKQTIDPKYPAELRKLLKQFQTVMTPKPK